MILISSFYTLDTNKLAAFFIGFVKFLDKTPLNLLL